MNNKEQMQKLRDNAELAWAAYGYFHLADKEYKHDGNDKERLEDFRELYKKKNLDSSATDEQLQSIYPTHADILDITYKYYLDKTGKPKDSWYHKHFLGGDFGKEQAQRFFQRYDLLKHCPNTDSGFSATLFGEKRKQKNTESKAIQYTSEYGYINYILAIISTESKKVAQ